VKRFLILFALLLLALPAMAQTPAPVPDPWAAGTNEITFQTTFHHDSVCADLEGISKDGGCWRGNGTLGWGYFVTDNSEVGGVVAVLYESDSTGIAYGPSYMYNLPFSPKAGLYFGGDGTILAGDASDLANFQAAVRMGLYRRMGRAAFRVGMDYSRAIDTKDTLAKSLDRIDFMLGISFGIPKSPTAP
jgi:hypothetical protein